MTLARIRIAFDIDSDQPTVFEKNVEFTDLREPGGKEFIAQYTFSRFETESRWGKHFLDLPSFDRFLRPVKQSFRFEEFASGGYEDRLNTREMWFEIGNTLLRAKGLLAHSLAYHEQELAHLSSQDPEAENLSWHLHLDKVEQFDLAVGALGKISDLTARLVFERLGASLLDRSKPGWERAIMLTNIRQALADRTENPVVASLTEAEYAELQAILNEFVPTERGMRLWGYRVRLTHRPKPSIDRGELYSHLESRERTPTLDENGQVKGWTKGIGGLRTSADYAFTDLYNDAIQTFRHYVSLLERLEAIPKFGPEAVASTSGGGSEIIGHTVPNGI